MDDKSTAFELYSQIKEQIAPLIEGKPNALINAALSEIMIDVALNGQTGKTRADAMAMLGMSMTRAAQNH
ncbi:hypothetical protein ATDW_36730 (plasmid) [Asticcacaulis sp. DW145]|uniref:hypothetical protein n=1 Tax=Asticcacaulis sp. DW145 TaxID=3095608 RepID=UPI003084ED41|nr:hypothetical protein ATDW_36730 [Asticcacaulis sp. DW145]